MSDKNGRYEKAWEKLNRAVVRLILDYADLLNKSNSYKPISVADIG